MGPPGLRRFREIANLRRVHSVLLCFDVSDRESLAHIREVSLQDVRRYAPESVSLVLLGLKSDCCTERVEVSDHEAADFAQTEGFQFVRASAKTGAGIEHALKAAVRDFDYRRIRTFAQPAQPAQLTRGCVVS